MEKKVKNILFKMSFEGNNIINYDGDSKKLKYIYKGYESMKHLFHYDDNVSYAKKNIYCSDDGDVNYKIKISSDNLRHHMFKDEIESQSTIIGHDNGVLLSYIASIPQILKGYLFTVKNGVGITKKKSSVFTLTDAEQTCNAKSKLEFFSKSGKKVTKEEEDDKGGTSVFVKETIGNIKYANRGFIDLKKLSFISSDDLFDRLAFNPDDFSLYKNFLKLRLPNFDSELGYFKSIKSICDLPEYGFTFSNENIIYMVKELLKKLITLSINKKNSFLNVVNVEYKLVYDPLVDTFESESGWIKATNENISQLDFETNDFYELLEYSESKKIRENLVDLQKKEREEEKKLAKIKVAKKNK